MKLQNFTVLFVIIVLPIIIVTSYYMSLQADTINMQTSYNTKLLESTKEAIEAFEINTVEWNSSYSATAESKRRDIMASINTFTTAFANNLGIAGSNSETILSYIPAIAYTLYDGYYIYSPAETKITAIDENGVTRYDEDGKIIYMTPGRSETTDPAEADTEYKHILKPFSAYSKQYKNGDTNVVINYTLDNYIRVYGTIGDEYVYKYGYLIDTNTDKINFNNLTISGLTLNGSSITPEVLSEQIAYDNTTGIFNYFYSTDNTKVYIDVDNTNFFILDHDGTKVNINELTQNTYKKCTIPKEISGNYTYIEIYYCLNDGEWYIKEKKDLEFSESNKLQINDEDKIIGYLGGETNIKYDYSAVNYCIESYVFSKWVQSNLSSITDTNGISIFNGENPEVSDSVFNQERRNVIKETLTSDLYQAITSYSRNSEGEYQLPNISETDWDQILSNVSILTFAQNIPIGMKYYNNYAIATSTFNKEYVDPNEIYLNADGDEYYHKPYCSYAGSTNIIGYRNIDYVVKSYENGDTTNYYYLHGYLDEHDKYQSSESCYYCLIQKDLYVEASGDLLTKEEKAYNTALARERYVAKTTRLPDEVESTYYIHTVPIIEDTGETIGSLKYKINDVTIAGDVRTPISNGETYTIKPPDDTTSTESLNSALPEYIGDYDKPNRTTQENVDTFSAYTANFNEININNIIKDTFGLSFNITPDSTNWGSDYEGTDFINKINPLSSDYGNGYINIHLPYKSTYTVNGDASATLTANINDYNDITLVTTVYNVDGYVRLKFTNGDKEEYYSNNIFYVSNGTEIYCQITNDISWYTDEWKVEVLSVDLNETLASKTVDYYTIRDANGLDGFSKAMNSLGTDDGDLYAKSEGREFRIIADNIQWPPEYMLENTPENTNYIPACYQNEHPFKGTFDGQGHTISGLNMSTAKGGLNQDILYWGLFGINNGTIKDLTITGIDIRLNKFEEVNKTYKAGGFAGENRGTIQNVTLSGGAIRGSAYTGGIAGDNAGTITGATVNGSAQIKTRGRYLEFKANNGSNSKQDSSIYLGGIAGNNKGVIKNINIGISGSDNVEIGISSEFNRTVKVLKGNDESSQTIGLKSYLYIGGVIGKLSAGGELSSIHTTDSSGNSGQVKVGIYEDKTLLNIESEILADSTKILIDNDSDKGTFVGGIIGYCSTGGSIQDITIPNSWQIIGKNFTLKKAYDAYSTGDDLFDSLAGLLESAGELASLIFNSPEDTYRNCTGGLVGYVDTDTNFAIYNCINNADITGESNTGGIVGMARSGHIKGCMNFGDITGINKATGTTNITDIKANVGLSIEWIDAYSGTGGIVGFNINATIQQSGNEGQINCNHSGGGIAGTDYKGTIKYCYNRGKVTNNLPENTGMAVAYNRLGGIAGVINATDIIKCYNTGDVIGASSWVSTPDESAVGGIAGVAFDFSDNEIYIQYCYNAGTVKGKRTPRWT